MPPSTTFRKTTIDKLQAIIKYLKTIPEDTFYLTLYSTWLSGYEYDLDLEDCVEDLHSKMKDLKAKQ